ncbi:MAG: FkbM family methyltransferase [Pyrinomonadaceae bacterium]|nr:FkbM family methyltransferase [Pyrinomonadaceae bacterium]
MIYAPSPNLIQHLHFKGVLNLSVKGRVFRMQHYGFQIENELFWLGIDNGWEKISLDLWSRLSEDSAVIFDIGANTGIFALVAQTMNPNAKVFAFEPVKRVYEKLEHNFEINDYPIEGFETAVSNYDGTATIYDKKDSEHILSVTVNKNLLASDSDTVPTEITTIRLDTIIEANGVEQIDLMKIDVETHEAEVLEGMGKYLEEFKPTMLIEILSDEVGKAVEELVKELDYLYFNIDEANSTVKKADTITKSDYFNYLLCREDIARKLSII